MVAQECAADVLEAEACRRAVEGVEKPVGWYKGEPGGYVREYSDILTIFLLKGLRPEKYRDRVEMRGALAHIDISQLPDHLLQRVADGEHILSVLASAVELGAAQSRSRWESQGEDLLVVFLDEHDSSYRIQYIVRPALINPHSPHLLAIPDIELDQTETLPATKRLVRIHVFVQERSSN